MVERGRVWLKWSIGACVVVLVAGGVAGVAFGGSDEKACGATDPTGVKAPHAKATEHPEWLKVIDTGMRMYEESDGGRHENQHVSFGFTVKNTSKYVLYGASVNIRLVDDEGKDVTKALSEDRQNDNKSALNDVDVPLVFPGQEVGLGGNARTWEQVNVDKEPGHGNLVKPVDYDKLKLKVKLIGGDWWNERNDVHAFATSTIKHPRVVHSKPADNAYYPSGPQGRWVDLQYRAVSRACVKTRAFPPSTLAFDAEGNIVGGGKPGNNLEFKGVDSYAPGRNDPLEGSEPVLVPGKDITFKMFPYMLPTKPKLTR